MQFFWQVCCELSCVEFFVVRSLVYAPCVVIPGLTRNPVSLGSSSCLPSDFRGTCFRISLGRSIRIPQSEMVYPLFLHYITEIRNFVKCGNWTYEEQAFFKGLDCRDLRIIVSS